MVNNVLTLAAVTTVLGTGAAFYRDFGTGDHAAPLRCNWRVIYAAAAWSNSPLAQRCVSWCRTTVAAAQADRCVRSRWVALGSLPAGVAQWDTPLDYEAFAGINAMLGHGGVVVFDDSVDMAAQARFAMAFCAGILRQCTPAVSVQCEDGGHRPRDRPGRRPPRTWRCCGICVTPWRPVPVRWAD